MTVTNLKARPKALPDRISRDISRSEVIVDRVVRQNELKHLVEPELSDLNDAVSVPLSFWLEHRTTMLSQCKTIAVQIAADESPQAIAEQLDEIDIVVLPFVSLQDGRSYSHAQRLRTDHHYQGQIRVTGDVKYDQLAFLQRVGVNAFELAEEEDIPQAATALNRLGEAYQPAADKVRLVFSRRRAKH
ncbi:MAG: DUF934 domain-containing protein [Pseudomonadota bacterium]